MLLDNLTCHDRRPKKISYFIQEKWPSCDVFSGSVTPQRTQPQWEPSSAQIQHQICIASETEPGGRGVEVCVFGGKSSVLRSRCASIRFWVDDGDLFFDCVCVVLYRCVCHLSFRLLLDLRCKAIAPRIVEKRCYCSLLTFFSLRLCSLMVALSLFLFLKFDGFSGPLFFASQFIVHSFRLNHHICCNMQLFLLFLTQSTRWK